jgi:iron-sulfur cluster repair protein YtfE (RIC family)
MSKLIDELQNEHEELLNMLNTIKMVGVKDASHLLIMAKDGLLNHLAKEDKMLYPRMKKEIALKELLDKYIKDMDKI